mmetsp:Transcript_49369/g.107508  ORF Transcript_49369/g.107508 Transcript_49369/m.107508 type:complete len:210 (+) Transcript_49369:1223-1852(+)
MPQPLLRMPQPRLPQPRPQPSQQPLLPQPARCSACRVQGQSHLVQGQGRLGSHRARISPVLESPGLPHRTKRRQGRTGQTRWCLEHFQDGYGCRHPTCWLPNQQLEAFDLDKGNPNEPESGPCHIAQNSSPVPSLEDVRGRQNQAICRTALCMDHHMAEMRLLGHALHSHRRRSRWEPPPYLGWSLAVRRQSGYRRCSRAHSAGRCPGP